MWCRVSCVAFLSSRLSHWRLALTSAHVSPAVPIALLSHTTMATGSRHSIAITSGPEGDADGQVKQARGR